jgi:hypothetical protein
VTRPQRRAHLWIWIAMGPLLAAGLVVALWARGPRPGASPAAAATERAR